METRTENIVTLVYGLQASIGSLREVLDGTSGLPRTELAGGAEEEPRTVENHLAEIRSGIVLATEEVQSLRERLQIVISELA